MFDFLVNMPWWVQLSLAIVIGWLACSISYAMGYNQAAKYHRERYDQLKLRLHASNYGLSTPMQVQTTSLDDALALGEAWKTSTKRPCSLDHETMSKELVEKGLGGSACPECDAFIVGVRQKNH